MPTFLLCPAILYEDITGPVTPPRQDESKTGRQTAAKQTKHTARCCRTCQSSTHRSVRMDHILTYRSRTYLGLFHNLKKPRPLVVLRRGGALQSSRRVFILAKDEWGGGKKMHAREKSRHTVTGSCGNVMWMPPLSQQPHRLPLTCKTDPVKPETLPRESFLFQPSKIRVGRLPMSVKHQNRLNLGEIFKENN